MRTSPARTAMWFRDQDDRVDPAGASGTPAASTPDLRVRLENDFGVVEQLLPAARMSGTPARWRTPGERAGRSDAVFLPR